LFTLVIWANGFARPGCLNVSVMNLVSGGPGWVKSEHFDVQAAIPKGAPSYTARQLERGEAPVLQRMIQNLLAERFSLVVRRETKETPIYVLTLAKDASAYPTSEEGGVWLSKKPERDGIPSDRSVVGKDDNILFARKASIAKLVPLLGRLMGRPVF